MAEWIKVEEGVSMGLTNNLTHVMEVPGGMVVRNCTMVGTTTTFVPAPIHYERGTNAPFWNQSEISKWIEDNKK